MAHIYSQDTTPVTNDQIRKLSFGLSSPTLLKNGEQILTTFHDEQINGELTLYITQLVGRALVTEGKAIFNIANVKFENSFLNGKFLLSSNVSKLTKVKTSIVSNQSKNWELELTMIPNGPVKLGFYQNGILLEEELIQKF